MSATTKSIVDNSLGKLKEGEAPHGIRYLSSYKAELIRHNVVTRTDLMRLYHPPLKQSQLPHKDPFVNRSIIPRPKTGIDEKNYMH